MRRPTLSTKLFAAALPLLVAVGALLALTVRSDLHEVQQAETGADLGRVWGPLTDTLTAIEGEMSATFGDGTDVGSTGTATPDEAALSTMRQATDQALAELEATLDPLDIAEAGGAHLTAARSDISIARRNIGIESTPGMQVEVDPVDAYESASAELVSVGGLLPSEAGESQLGRELLATVKLAEARLAAVDVLVNVTNWQLQPGDWSPLATARSSFNRLDSALNEFETIAPEEWVVDYRNTGFNTSLARYRTELDRALRSAQDGDVAEFDIAGFTTMIVESSDFQDAISQSIVDRASDEAASARRTALIRIGVILAVVLLAGVIAWWMTRSVTRRVKAVSDSAKQVADVQLPALVEAIRDPRGNAVLPEIAPLDARGSDELAELAEAFNSMQGTVVDVAHEQVEVLHRGVSDLFVTMARRNRSLIDRQLAMLDEFEAEVDDAEVLSNYYQLDHMATRMRRNSESLLVLANAEPKRRRVKATEIDDVVRAAIGEVEDYRRIEVEHLESLQVRGNVVADISHLVAELLDNATSFSPPDSPVRVGGRRTGDAYMLRIVDSGVGIGADRMQELNELLAEPPIVGLSVESTLGMSVVSLLANKHDIQVTLTPGSPGLIVDIVIPSALFGPIDAPVDAPTAAVDPYAPPADTAEPTGPADGPAVPHPALGQIDIASLRGETAPASMPPPPAPSPSEPARAGFDAPVAPTNPTAAPPAPYGAPVDPFGAPDEERRVAPGDLASMSSSLSAFQNGRAAAAPPEPPAPAAPTAALPAPTVGEFDVPPAPPLSADGPSRRPVAPASAHPAPHPTGRDAGPLLPVRNRGGSTGPEGPDRLADPAPSVGDDGNGVAGDDHRDAAGIGPSALQAALAAFDAGRGTDPSALPTRAPSDGPDDTGADESSTSPTRMDPDALRERLRAFQSEFKTGLSAPRAEQQPDNNDLGGDLR